MPNTHRPYAPEFRQQMVELVRWSDSLGAYDPSDIRFQLTGRAAPINHPAPADLVGRSPAAPPEQPTCHPWRQGGNHGWRTSGVISLGLPASGMSRTRRVSYDHLRVGGAVAKRKDAGGTVIEHEDIWDADPFGTMVAAAGRPPSAEAWLPGRHPD